MFPLANERGKAVIATMALVSLNFVCYFIERPALNAGGLAQIYQTWGVTPVRLIELLSSGDPWNVALSFRSLFAAMFLHESYSHLVGNMLCLYLFARKVESQLGWARLATLYLISGLSGWVVQMVAEPHLSVPILGASGAVFGVAGAHLASLWLDDAGRFQRLFETALYLSWIGMEVNLATSRVTSTVSHWSHVGGAAGGFFLAGLWLLCAWLSARGKEQRLGQPGPAVPAP